jgi:hypothetical protein
VTGPEDGIGGSSTYGPNGGKGTIASIVAMAWFIIAMWWRIICRRAFCSAVCAFWSFVLAVHTEGDITNLSNRWLAALPARELLFRSGQCSPSAF